MYFTKVFPNSDASNIQIAFVIAVCTTFLNPKYKYINAKENTMRQKVKHYIVSFRNFVLNCNIFLLFTNLLITLKNKLEKEFFNIYIYYIFFFACCHAHICF